MDILTHCIPASLGLGLTILGCYQADSVSACGHAHPFILLTSLELLMQLQPLLGTSLFMLPLLPYSRVINSRAPLD